MEKLKRSLLGVGDGEIRDGLLNGWEITAEQFTMIGYNRLTNIEFIIKEIVANKIDGDVIETGVWRGGACIFMKGLLNFYKSDKKVYVADSFEGLPAPDPKYVYDDGDTHHNVPMLSVSEDVVRANFINFGLLDDKVIFVKGWFKNTLPLLTAKFSLIRLDGDMYESTMDALVSLYPKLEAGGYCVIDDFNIVKGCQIAVLEYMANDIDVEFIQIDGHAIYWKKIKEHNENIDWTEKYSRLNKQLCTD